MPVLCSAFHPVEEAESFHEVIFEPSSNQVGVQEQREQSPADANLIIFPRTRLPSYPAPKASPEVNQNEEEEEEAEDTNAQNEATALLPVTPVVVKITSHASSRSSDENEEVAEFNPLHRTSKSLPQPTSKARVHPEPEKKKDSGLGRRLPKTLLGKMSRLALRPNVGGDKEEHTSLSRTSGRWEEASSHSSQRGRLEGKKTSTRRHHGSRTLTSMASRFTSKAHTQDEQGGKHEDVAEEQTSTHRRLSTMWTSIGSRLDFGKEEKREDVEQQGYSTPIKRSSGMWPAFPSSPTASARQRSKDSTPHHRGTTKIPRTGSRLGLRSNTPTSAEALSYAVSSSPNDAKAKACSSGTLSRAKGRCRDILANRKQRKDDRNSTSSPVPDAPTADEEAPPPQLPYLQRVASAHSDLRPATPGSELDEDGVVVDWDDNFVAAWGQYNHEQDGYVVPAGPGPRTTADAGQDAEDHSRAANEQALHDYEPPADANTDWPLVMVSQNPSQHQHLPTPHISTNAEEMFLEAQRVAHEEEERALLALVSYRTRTYRCVVCEQELLHTAFPKRIITISCQHARDVCKGCLTASVDEQFYSMQGEKMQCPACPASLNWREVKEYASEAVFKAYVHSFTR